MAGFWIPDKHCVFSGMTGKGRDPPGLVSGVNKFIGYNRDVF